MELARLKICAAVSLSFLFLPGCASAPERTPFPSLPTYTPNPTVTPYPTFSPTPVPSAPRPASVTPGLDFVLPEARTKYTFEQIVPLLSTPQLVSMFMKNNVKLDGDYDNKTCGGNCYYPASLVYTNGIDDSDGHAILQCSILEKNGWEAYMIGLAIDTPVGHNVCGVDIDQTVLVLDDAGQIVGPFKSLAAVAEFYLERGEMKQGGKLGTIRASQITQIATDTSKPSVLGLPWTFHQY